jgi:hypothetical protein
MVRLKRVFCLASDVAGYLSNEGFKLYWSKIKPKTMLSIRTLKLKCILHIQPSVLINELFLTTKLTL